MSNFLDQNHPYIRDFVAVQKTRSRVLSLEFLNQIIHSCSASFFKQYMKMKTY